MLYPIMIVVSAGAMLLAGGAQGERTEVSARLDLEPAINGAVSAQGLFPSQAMEEQFDAYLRWTKGEGLSRLAAYETCPPGLAAALTDVASANGRFPTQAMADQFRAYREWVAQSDRGDFYAFRVTDFD